MEMFEHSPFKDISVPYIVYPERNQQRLRRLWEALATTPLPMVSRWAIYQAFRVWG